MAADKANKMFQESAKNIRELLDLHERNLLVQIDKLLTQGALLRAELSEKEDELIELRIRKMAMRKLRSPRFAAIEENNWSDDDSG
jgi:hypothetical protein